MSKFKKILKKIVNIIFNPYIRLYYILSIFIRRVFCNHNYRYWKMRIVVNNQNSSLKNLHGNEMVKWRRCDKCDKKQELSMVPGNWRWKTTVKDLPDNKNVIDVEVRQIGEESKSEKRDRLIEEILK